jgi:hypothetical protein
MSEPERLSILNDYASGRTSTRATIDKLGLRDYADLVIELVRAGLPFPKPDDTPELAAHRKRARAILLPRLQSGSSGNDRRA